MVSLEMIVKIVNVKNKLVRELSKMFLALFFVAIVFFFGLNVFLHKPSGFCRKSAMNVTMNGAMEEIKANYSLINIQNSDRNKVKVLVSKESIKSPFFRKYCLYTFEDGLLVEQKIVSGD